MNNNITEDRIIIEEPPIIASSYHKGLNCIDFSEHFQSCPICSKFYKRDTTLHNIIIVALILVCILMLKYILKL